MSIKIENLTKRYGAQTAVDSATFEIGKATVTGLLGSNGAGKSTIMKMLTGFVQPTAGKAFIDNINVCLQPLAAKRMTGYLPEHNPLYHDMYIVEYLQFVYGIYSLDRGCVRQKVRSIMERTGLMPEKNKKIGQLSKGYRQRVGLAQALIHDPQVLILDEPTSGLDPNQLAEIRTLIADVGREKTIMLSTHIMQEVEAVCSNVIIINKGKIIAYDTPQNIRRMAENAAALPVQVKLMDENVAAQQWQCEFVVRAEQMSAVDWLVYGRNGEDFRPLIFNHAVQNHWTILEMTQQAKPLEEAFRLLTE
jgi:ABC-2 type transport system ATP-binding protein